MIRRNLLCCLLMIGTLLPGYAQVTSTVGLREMRDYFDRMGDGPYAFLQTPRTGMGVGTIFTVVDGQTIFYSRPEECFAPDFLASSVADEMKVSNFSLSGKYNWKLGAKIANAGAVTEEVEAEFARKGVQHAILKMPSLRRRVMTAKALTDNIKHKMDIDCRAVFAAQRPTRWIIIEDLYTDSFSLEFQDAKGTNAGISAKILKALFPSFKYESESEYKGELQFSGVNHIVAIKAVKTKEINRYSSSDDLEVVNPSELYKIFDSPVGR